MDRVRILFMPAVDAGNTNAQSLNVREIALRLNPERFSISLWHEGEPDPRLKDRSNIRLMQLPAHGKTGTIFREMLRGYDIVSYIDYSPASYLFLHMPRVLRRRTKAVYHAEAPAAQMVNPSRRLRFLYDGTFPRCDFYTGITDYIARDLFSTARKRASHILPVGVDTKLFSPPRKRANPAPVVLFAGTLIERKGPQLVIDAAVRFPGAVFRLVGAGREGYENVLRGKVAQLNLRNVTMEGAKTQAEMIEIMRTSDVFLLPSRLEGIPKVTLEAAATGLPCVVFRDYETPSVVHGSTGFQVATVEEMMQAVGRFIFDRSLRGSMGAAAREHMEEFDWDRVSRVWQNAYLEIAGQAI